MQKEIKICFFTSEKNKRTLQFISYYKNDIYLLKFFSNNVVIATRPHEIPWDCDLYCSWWLAGSIVPFFISKLKRKPLIILGHGSDSCTKFISPGYYKCKSIFQKLCIRLVLKFANHVCVMSKTCYVECKKLGMQNGSVVFLGVDTDIYFFTQSSQRKQNVIISIADIGYRGVFVKGLIDIIESLPHIKEKIPDIELVIIGRKFKEFDFLYTLAKKLNVLDLVSFTGELNEKEKIQYLSQGTIYMQPTRQEAFGHAIVEALSCGIPVITSNCAYSAVYEIVDNCGIYVTPGDINGIADAAVRLLKDNGIRNDLSIRGRKRVENFFSLQKRKEVLKKIIENT